MNVRELTASRTMRAALAALAIALATVAWTLAGALRSHDVPDAAPNTLAITGALSTPPRVPIVSIRAAVDRDPFQDDRTAPTKRYRVPGEDDPDATPVASDVVLPVVLGTGVSLGGRSFATCQLGTERAAIVRVGDKFGEYTVKLIERGHVVFTTKAGKQLDIPALKSGS